MARNPRLTIDYPEDLEVMKCVYDVIGYNDFDIDTLKIHLDSTLKHVTQWNKQPEVTVYTCVHNGQDTVKRAIDSVLEQDFKDYEYIVCDDRSTDNTREVLWEYVNEPNVKYVINDKNIGLAASCNKVLEQARGKYYIRLDADDEFSNVDSIQKMYQKMEGNPHAAICYSDYVNRYSESGFCDDGRKWSASSADEIISNSDHHMGCAMVQAKAFQETKFNNNFRHWDGYDFYLRAKEKFDIIYLNEPTWIYHQTKGSMSKSEPEERERVKQEIENKNEK